MTDTAFPNIDIEGFIIWGILLNIGIELIVLLLRYVIIKRSSPYNADSYKEFMRSRDNYIIHHNSPLKIILCGLARDFIPTYGAWIYSIQGWHMLSSPTAVGVVQGIVASDRREAFGLKLPINVEIVVE